MSRFAWSDQITTISSTYERWNSRRHDERDAPGLEDLKSALDDWAPGLGLLMATNEVDYSSFQERFRSGGPRRCAPR